MPVFILSRAALRAASTATSATIAIAATVVAWFTRVGKAIAKVSGHFCRGSVVAALRVAFCRVHAVCAVARGAVIAFTPFVSFTAWRTLLARFVARIILRHWCRDVDFRGGSSALGV